MPLESLLELVKTLSDRIDEHAAALRQSEALTRYALIDPLLRELGWDTEDPGMVIPEYRSGNGRADYALMNNGSSAMMVEAKSFGTSLGGAVLSQGIQYCLEQGTRFFCVTDGSQWEIYETHRPVPIDQKQIVSFNLKNMPPHEVCLKALAIWRRSVETGQVNVGQPPLVQIPPDHPDIPDVPISDADGWQSISTLCPEFGADPPSEISFPDGDVKPIRYWVDVPAAVVQWLVDNHTLNESHCPIQYGENAILSTIPSHPDGRSMRHRKVGPLYMNTNYTGRDQIRNTRLIIERGGQDPSEFKVRLP